MWYGDENPEKLLNQNEGAVVREGSKRAISRSDIVQWVVPDEKHSERRKTEELKSDVFHETGIVNRQLGRSQSVQRSIERFDTARLPPKFAIYPQQLSFRSPLSFKVIRTSADSLRLSVLVVKYSSKKLLSAITSKPSIA